MSAWIALERFTVGLRTRSIGARPARNSTANRPKIANSSKNMPERARRRDAVRPADPCAMSSIKASRSLVSPTSSLFPALPPPPPPSLEPRRPGPPSSSFDEPAPVPPAPAAAPNVDRPASILFRRARETLVRVPLGSACLDRAYSTDTDDRNDLDKAGVSGEIFCARWIGKQDHRMSKTSDSTGNGHAFPKLA